MNLSGSAADIMNKLKMPLWLAVIIALAYIICVQPRLSNRQPANAPPQQLQEVLQSAESANISVEEDGEYSDKDQVALYIHIYGKLPKNYITKNEAEREGWQSHEGNLAVVLPGRSIGGDLFSNFEGSLPTKKGRIYTECDIDYKHGNRNAKRIIFSSDGLIFYTDDHYKSFEQLY